MVEQGWTTKTKTKIPRGVKHTRIQSDPKPNKINRVRFNWVRKSKSGNSCYPDKPKVYLELDFELLYIYFLGFGSTRLTRIIFLV